MTTITQFRPRRFPIRSTYEPPRQTMQTRSVEVTLPMLLTALLASRAALQWLDAIWRTLILAIFLSSPQICLDCRLPAQVTISAVSCRSCSTVAWEAGESRSSSSRSNHRKSITTLASQRRPSQSKSMPTLSTWMRPLLISWNLLEESTPQAWPMRTLLISTLRALCWIMRTTQVALIAMQSRS